MIRLCIFDLDGTLAETVDSMALAANKVLRELGLSQLEPDGFRYFAGDGAKELCRRCLRAAGDETCVHYEEMYRRYRLYFKETCMYHVKPYQGISELLERLKQTGIRICVLSNKPHPQAVDVVESLFGKGYFDAVQGQTEKVPRKPSPVGANLLAESFHVEKKECLYIGDTATDMETGRKAGMTTVGVLWGFRDREELEKSRADCIVGCPEEILNIVERGGSHD